MSYSSIEFILFVGITVLAYFLLPLKNNKWIVLLLASYTFYLFAGYKYIIFIILTTISTYLVARWIDKVALKSKQLIKENKAEWNKEEKKEHKRKIKIKKRLIMLIALLFNFGVLALLKYYNFTVGNINGIIGALGFDLSAPTLNLFLPLGISFYTFQSMGYVVDVYRGRVSAEKNPLKLALFVSFFPHIIQGPISFYSQLAHQLYQPHKFDFRRFKYGCELILWGFVKKLIIADRAVIAINTVTENYNAYNGTTLTFTVVLYALQIYADFSGGIDISRGVAQIFGIDMAENFRRPYFSKSINEYWRRWHITLGAWMKEYVFYPVAMSGAIINTSKKIKGKKENAGKIKAHISMVFPSAVASFVVFLIVGIWHGATWNNVAFGLWNGSVITLSIILKPIFDIVLEKLHINAKSFAYGVFQMFRTFLIVLVSYVFDIAPSFTQSLRTIKMFFVDQNIRTGISQIRGLGMGTKDFVIIILGAIIIFVASVIQERNPDTTIRQMLDNRAFIIRFAVILIAVIGIILCGIYGPGYNAADFVYMQF